MAWTEADRVTIRDALGFSAIFLQADPRLEQAITAVQAVSDGGARPDNSTELAIRALLAELADIDSKIVALRIQAQALVIDPQSGLRIDAPRGRQMLVKDGRHIVNRIARTLATHPRADRFAQAPSNENEDTFYYPGGPGYQW